MTGRAIRSIVLIWLVWSVILIGYMQLVQMRYEPDRPDDALTWSAQETTRNSQRDKPYLNDPFLNTQVSWDSEFYLSIATVGYDDPDVRVVEEGGTGYSMNYAFMPFYPLVMKVVRLPFTLIGMTPIGASVAAGVLVSLLGALAGMIALYDIVRAELGEEGGIRTAFLLLVFPMSMFFATVYTEGLFVGLSFGSLALMRRKQFIFAAALAACATATRSIGGALLVPLLLAWFVSFRQATNKRTLLIQLPVLVLLPVGAYLLWRMANGVQYDFVQANWFGNAPLDIATTLDAWGQFLERARTTPETAVVVALEITTVALALLSCIWCFRRYPLLAIFGLIGLVVSITSGWNSTNSSIRYMLTVPTLWIMLGRWTRNSVFERGWIVACVLLLAMQAYLFSFDFWVA
ncbi:MAG: hypothetical protein IAE80_28930 [Anaerolinea sp.]|nr:hypothetical protein [Anaerolinea sp.]